MKKINWINETLLIEMLKPADYNPRKISDKQKKDLRKSLEKFGTADPLIVNNNNVIIGGHARLKALLDLGAKEAEVRKPTRLLDEAEEKELNLRLNKNGGEFDWGMLADFGEDMLIDVGFEPEELESIFGLAEECEDGEGDDDVPEVKEEPFAKMGDVLELNEHRIICGDCLDVVCIETLMNGKKAILATNDPPYGMKKEKEGVLNDNLNYSDLLDFNREWISLQMSFLENNASWYCWGTDEPLMDIYSEILKPYIKENQLTFRNLITWDKGNGQGQKTDNTRSYATADEKCLFIMVGVQGFNNNTENYYEGWEVIRKYLNEEANKVNLTASKLKEICGVGMYAYWFIKSQWALIPEEHYIKLQDYFKKDYDVFKKDYDEIKKDYDEIKKEYYETRAYFDNTHDNFNNVWHFERHKRDGQEGKHATPKPIDLCVRQIKSSSPKNGIVLDFFLGSGSTLIACEKTNRVCYGTEISPQYVSVIVKRWLKYMLENKKDKDITVKCNGEEINYKELI